MVEMKIEVEKTYGIMMLYIAETGGHKFKIV